MKLEQFRVPLVPPAMWKSIQVIAIVVVAICAEQSCAVGATLHAQLYPHTGEVRLRNKSTTPISLVFYSINSTGNALNSSPSVWKSIENFYDVSGDGFIDPNDDWVIISALSTQLTEGVFIGDGGSLAAQRSVSLGQIWNPNAPNPNLTFEAREANEQPITVVTELTVSGDYFVDGVVNQLDYGVWRQSFDSTTTLDADGNLDGIVNAADYIIWRNNLGLQASMVSQGAALPSLSPAAVPEPNAAVLLAAGCGLCSTIRLRRPRHQPKAQARNVSAGFPRLRFGLVFRSTPFIGPAATPPFVLREARRCAARP
jgi:hypothetical protein